MHAAGEDLRICLLKPATAAARFRRPDRRRAGGFSYPLSLVNLVAQVSKVALAGSETRTDWRQRPLTPAQLHYALDDVRYLLDRCRPVSARSRSRSNRLGRGRV